jgi:hypothetical protein
MVADIPDRDCFSCFWWGLLVEISQGITFTVFFASWNDSSCTVDFICREVQGKKKSGEYE